jgi:imidazolonepropionase-like amidohydrolase
MNAREFGDYVDLGMTPAQALLTSSQGAARLLGVQDETGTLVAGKSADVVAVPGNVLEDIRATERPVLVVARGKVVVGP